MKRYILRAKTPKETQTMDCRCEPAGLVNMIGENFPDPEIVKVKEIGLDDIEVIHDGDFNGSFVVKDSKYICRNGHEIDSLLDERCPACLTKDMKKEKEYPSLRKRKI